MNANLKYVQGKWILDTPIVLSPIQLESVVRYTMEIYRKRLRGEIGERRRNMENALLTLNSRNITQSLSGPEPVLYSLTT
jgi:hypothetical protein